MPDGGNRGGYGGYVGYQPADTAMYPTPAVLILAVLLMLDVAPPGVAQAEESESAEKDDMTGSFGIAPPAVIPSPEPFSLSAYDARHAHALLERVGFVQIRRGDGAPRTVRVRSVGAVPIGYEEGMPPGSRIRYDLRLNEEPLEWDRTYVRYGGRMVSLRLLFTYRNQHPPEDLQYTGNDYTW
ncbi:MAG: hypothetical protein ACLFMV_09500 [Spirochaetaceae bacterium]